MGNQEQTLKNSEEASSSETIQLRNQNEALLNRNNQLERQIEQLRNQNTQLRDENENSKLEMSKLNIESNNEDDANNLYGWTDAGTDDEEDEDTEFENGNHDLDENEWVLAEAVEQIFPNYRNTLVL